MNTPGEVQLSPGGTGLALVDGCTLDRCGRGWEPCGGCRRGIRHFLLFHRDTTGEVSQHQDRKDRAEVNNGFHDFFAGDSLTDVASDVWNETSIATKNGGQHDVPSWTSTSWKATGM